MGFVCFSGSAACEVPCSYTLANTRFQASSESTKLRKSGSAIEKEIWGSSPDESWFDDLGLGALLW